MKTKAILTAVLVGTFACNDPSAKQKEADKAREQARQESDKAARAAEQTRLEQQANVDEKQREATRSLEAARLDYRGKINDVLGDIEKNVADLQAKNVTASAKEKAANTDRMAQLQAKKAILMRDLEDVDRATSAMWNELKSRVDGHLRDARTLIHPLFGKT